ncbi:hypothetical protein GCM10018779_13190 [Streptomyces griseocarneus]|nr:hypothetical protein GCM10018779_13190 [Streptomyces griseocarneus]
MARRGTPAVFFGLLGAAGAETTTATESSPIGRRENHEAVAPPARPPPHFTLTAAHAASTARYCRLSVP